MKLITSLLGLVALMLLSPVLAQEESPSPAPEEQASTTVEETSAPTPSPTAETKATATTATTPAAEKKEPAAAGKKASPAASPSAAPTGKKMNPQAALKDSENRWAVALAKHDIPVVEAMVAADFIGVNQKGKVQNRRGLLGDIKADKDTYTSTKNEKLDVKMYGSDVGVVVGTYREKGTGKDGKTFDRTMRFTDTWMDRGGQWQCIASQVMVVSQK